MNNQTTNVVRRAFQVSRYQPHQRSVPVSNTPASETPTGVDPVFDQMSQLFEILRRLGHIERHVIDVREGLGIPRHSVRNEIRK